MNTKPQFPIEVLVACLSLAQSSVAWSLDAGSEAPRENIAAHDSVAPQPVMPVQLDVSMLEDPIEIDGFAGLEPPEVDNPAATMALTEILTPQEITRVVLESSAGSLGVETIAQGSGVTSATAPQRSQTIPPQVANPHADITSNQHEHLRPMLKRLGDAVLRFSTSALFETANNKEATADVQFAAANRIVHGRLKPLKLRHGVEKVASSLSMPADSIISRKHFDFSHAAMARQDQSIALNVDPDDTRAIERAIRDLMDSNPKMFGLEDENGNRALTNDDLALVHITKASGDGARADTIHAVFRQVRKGDNENGHPYYLPVYGASLSLTFKVLGGKPVLKGLDGHFASVNVDMKARFGIDALQSAAQQRLMPMTATGRLLVKFRRIFLKPLGLSSKFDGRMPDFLNREIIPDDKGRWHAANIYQGTDVNGQPINIGVDIATGKAFAWDAHGHSLRPKRPKPRPSGRPAAVSVHLVTSIDAGGGAPPATSVTVMGRGNKVLHGDDHGPIDAMPMPHLKIRDPKGNLVGVTDDSGRLTLADGSAIEVTVGTDGDYAAVDDADAKNRPLNINLRLAKGHENRIVLNPTSDNEELAGQINSYLGWNLLLRWMKSIGIKDKRVDLPLAIHNNKSDMPCNAYYDPLSDTLNLEQGNEDCENTAQPSILLHESGHRFVQFFARIDGGFLASLKERLSLADEAFQYLRQGVEFVMGGGVNEGTADTISMYFRDNPKIGEGLFKHPRPGLPLIVRDGRNIRTYKPGEVHDEGETLMGATWEIYDALKNILGETAGAAYAAEMVIPTLIFSQPRDVPTAMAQLLLAAMHADGTSPFADIVRRAARRRGIPLPDFYDGPKKASLRQLEVHS